MVATNVGGLSRAISDGRTGLLVDGHDASDWADALEALYDDPDTREDMGRAGRDPGARVFGWQRTAAITLESYQEAVGGLLVPAALSSARDAPGLVDCRAQPRTASSSIPAAAHEPKDNDV